MNLIKRDNDYLYDPWKEMDRLLGFTFPAFFRNELPALAGSWVPAIDIYDEGDKLVVIAELPGLEKNNIQVAVNGDVLTIKGEKKKDDKVKKENYYRTERYNGSFQRNIRLANVIDTSKVKASFKDGILELVLPKSETSKEKRIEIK